MSFRACDGGVERCGQYRLANPLKVVQNFVHWNR